MTTPIVSEGEAPSPWPLQPLDEPRAGPAQARPHDAATAAGDLYAEGRSIARGIIEASWPASRFHHREHCLATACLILEHPNTRWELELPLIIRRYNIAMGGANTDEAGYHETLTQFFLAEIRRFLAAHSTLAPAECCRALLGSSIGAREHVLRYYSRERLYSRAARRAYLAPDLDAPGASPGLP